MCVCIYIHKYTYVYLCIHIKLLYIWYILKLLLCIFSWKCFSGKAFLGYLFNWIIGELNVIFLKKKKVFFPLSEKGALRKCHYMFTLAAHSTLRCYFVSESSVCSSQDGTTPFKSLFFPYMLLIVHTISCFHFYFPSVLVSLPQRARMDGMCEENYSKALTHTIMRSKWIKNAEEAGDLKTAAEPAVGA